VTQHARERTVVALVAGSHFVNHAYLVLLPPIIGVLASTFDVGIAAIGLAIGVQGAITTALQLPFGHLSDTRSRTLVLGVSLCLGAAGAALVATARSYEWLLLAQVVLGVGIAGHHPAHYPLLAAAAEEDRRGRAYSVHAFGGSAGFAAPFALVAVVTALGGTWRHAVGLVAVFGFAYAVVCLGLMRGVDREITHPAPAERRESASRRETLPGARTVVRRAVGGVTALVAAPGIRDLTVLAFVTSAAAWGIRTYTPTLLEAAYGLSPNAANALVSAMFVVEAGLILLGGALTDRIGSGRVMLGGYVALGALAAALSTGALPLVLLASILFFSGTISVSRPARSTLADRLSARADLGKNFALVTVGISLGGAIAPPAFGWLLGVRGVETVFAVVALLGFASLGFAYRICRRADGPSEAAVATEGADDGVDD
jgi:MFS family permease